MKMLSRRALGIVWCVRRGLMPGNIITKKEPGVCHALWRRHLAISLWVGTGMASEGTSKIYLRYRDGVRATYCTILVKIGIT